MFKTREARRIAAPTGATASPGKSDSSSRDVKASRSWWTGRSTKTRSDIESKCGPSTRLPAPRSTTASQNVPDKAGVLKTVASMATNVRVALGESKSEMTKVAAAETVSASSRGHEARTLAARS